MSTTQPDEIIFALFYDGELDKDEEARFIESLQNDAALRQQYDAWAEALEAMQDHIIAQEEAYPLDNFSDRVMAALPSEAPQRVSMPSREHEIASEDQNGFMSWWKQAWMPALIGGIAAALVLIIMQQLNAPSNQVTPTTNVISYEGDKGTTEGERTVIWVVDDESDEEDDSKEDDGI